MSFTSFFVPVIVAFILCYGLFRRVKVFDIFVRGAMDGAKVAVSILPALIGLLTCVAMFRASGALDFLIALARPVAQVLGFPEELLPLALLRPISGSGGIAVLQDILSTYGRGQLYRAGGVGAGRIGGNNFLYHCRILYKRRRAEYPLYAAGRAGRRSRGLFAQRRGSAAVAAVTLTRFHAVATGFATGRVEKPGTATDSRNYR